MYSLELRSALEHARSAIRWRLGYSIDILDSASSEILDPGHVVTGLPCIALPGQFERVKACAFGLDLRTEVAQLEGAPRHIGPTRRYLLKDVVVRDGILYGQGKRKGFNSDLDFNSHDRSWQEYSEVALRSSLVGCHFFGHWLRDDCATHLLAEEAAQPISMPTPAWPDCEGYTEHFSQEYTSVRRAHIDRLHLFDDIHQNSSKARRFMQLRKASSREASPSRQKIVYMMRGAQGKQRTLLNERELVEALSARGILVLKAETLAIDELIRQLSGATIVISVEGSQLSHALFNLRDKGGVLAIQPPDRFFNSHFDWARALEMQYGVVIGIAQETGFYVPIDEILKTLDLLLAKIS